MSQFIAATSGTEAESTALPYPPSWFDRLKQVVDRLPAPAWLFYGVLAVAPAPLFIWSQWQAGRYDVTFVPFHLFLAALSGATLGFLHYLDRRAAAAVDRVEPHLALDSARLRLLRYRLTTIPAGPTLAASLLGAAAALGATVLALTAAPEFMRSLGIDQSGIAVAGFALVMGATWFCGGALLVHTFHQLRTVRRTNRDDVTIDVLDLTPVYAFSGLTAITAIGIVGQGYLWLLTNPRLVGAGAAVVAVIAASALGGVVFALPMWGIHRRIVDEKARQAGVTARHRRTMVGDLLEGIEAGDLARASAIKDAVLALETEERAIDRIRTWPWEPETIRLLLTAVLLPTALFVTQFVLQRALGG